MEEGTANTKPSWQQSAYTRAYAVAEPGLVNHVEYQNHAFASLVDPNPSQLAESTFPVGATYNAGTAFPNRPGHYSWAPPVAAGPTDRYANSNFQDLDPSFSMMSPYATGIIGNGYGGQLQTNGFNTHTIAAGAFSDASYTVDSGNSFGGHYAANGFGTQMSAAGAFSDTSHAVNNGSSYGGFPTQLMAPDADPSAFRAIDSGNTYGGQFCANGFDTPLMVPEAYPNALLAIDSSPVHGGQFPASGFQNQQSTAIELPNAPPAVDDNATPLGPAHVAPARHTCPECKTAFKRRGELKRHAKKHQADSNVFRCVVAGCVYNSYRKDKLDDHVKKHRRAVTASAFT